MKPGQEAHYLKPSKPSPELRGLRNIKWSDNTCSIGWSSAHAQGWTEQECEFILSICQIATFTPTFYLDGDVRRMYKTQCEHERDRFGMVLLDKPRPAYVNFPMNNSGLEILLHLGFGEYVMTIASLLASRSYAYQHSGWHNLPYELRRFENERT